MADNVIDDETREEIEKALEDMDNRLEKVINTAEFVKKTRLEREKNFSSESPNEKARNRIITENHMSLLSELRTNVLFDIVHNPDLSADSELAKKLNRASRFVWEEFSLLHEEKNKREPLKDKPVQGKRGPENPDINNSPGLGEIVNNLFKGELWGPEPTGETGGSNSEPGENAGDISAREIAETVNFIEGIQKNTGSNYRRFAKTQDGEEDFRNIKEIDSAIDHAAEEAGIKRERPDIATMAAMSVGIGTGVSHNGRYEVTPFGGTDRGYSLNSIHITPSLGLKKYIPEPNITAEEDRQLREEYDVASLKERVRNIMLGYRIDEYSRIAGNTDSRTAMIHASENMVHAANDLVISSQLFNIISSPNPEHRVWAQKIMMEVFEDAANEFEYHANNLIDRLDPAILEKKARDREKYAKEMEALGKQGIQQVTDPSNMFAIFVLMNFCPVFAVGLLVPMLLPNLVSWGTHRMAEHASFAAKDEASLRTQEKSSVMSAKIMGNALIAKIVPIMGCDASPEELTRFIESIKDELKKYGVELQGQIAKGLDEVSKMTGDGKTIVPGSAAAGKVEEIFRIISERAVSTMLEINENGETGAIVERVKAVGDIAKLTKSADFFTLYDNPDTGICGLKLREKDKMFTSESAYSKKLTESHVRDAESFIEDINQILTFGTVTSETYGKRLEISARSSTNKNFREKVAEAKKKLETENKKRDEFLRKRSPFYMDLKEKRKKRGENPLNIAKRTKDRKILSSRTIREYGFSMQKTHSEILGVMLSLQKDGTKLDSNSPLHYTKYGYSRNKKGVRVGKSVDIKAPTLYSAVMSVSGAIQKSAVSEKEIEKNLNRKIKELNREKTELKKLADIFKIDEDELIVGINTIFSKEISPEERIEKIEPFVKNLEHEIKKLEEGQRDDEGGVYLEKLKDLKKKMEDFQKTLAGNEKNENSTVSPDDDIAASAQEIRRALLGYSEQLEKDIQMEIDRMVSEKSRRDDLIVAFVSDMSMRIVPQEAWGAIYSLDTKFLDAREINSRTEKEILERHQKFLKGFKNEDTENIEKIKGIKSAMELAGEKLHEANKLSLAAFVLSKQVHTEQAARAARGEGGPEHATLTEKMALSTISGFLIQASILEKEAAPVMARGIMEIRDMDNLARSEGKGQLSSFLSDMSSMLKNCVESSTRYTGGKLLGERIAEASDSLGYNIRDMVSEYAGMIPVNPGEEAEAGTGTKGALLRAIDSEELSGRVSFNGPFNSKVDSIARNAESSSEVWEVQSNRKHYENALDEMNKLQDMQRKSDLFLNEEFRSLSLVGNGPEQEKKLDRMMSTLTAWCNNTAVSGLLANLLGTHLDADVAEAERNISRKPHDIKKSRDNEKEKSGIIAQMMEGIYTGITGMFEKKESPVIEDREKSAGQEKENVPEIFGFGL